METITSSAEFYTIDEFIAKYPNAKEPIMVSEVMEGTHPKYSSETISIVGDVMIIRLPLKEKLIYNP